ncbi:hypothetical protein EF847_06085 [Actinobacteria bacterium YIM 96077]|uniref:ATPase BadF/BadG/BcrA/BcrD type domain-containing protein n=1 Tax=Phytoactinopolyspora halophila TaxID=1981511 RepID=A0A329QPT8_9ACTN|nr:BadF/BadG/BcrA/BcrD ATPase family protein [Phytoactinopolyspora halophila]AYY12343.1 hypothetical protein EF847_06085 [Actinobacteria bacterium YIM 96077]RAW13739.1 hypothetical protein DPM12_12070 [Phytoactinopolyspora halophila]
MNQTGIAGVDVGGSGIRVRVDPGAREAQDREPPPRVNGKIDLGQLAPRIIDALDMAAPGAAGFAGMAIGMTGLPGLVDDPRPLWDGMRARFYIGSLAVAGDALTTHVGALGFHPGVVVAAGTGVITLGTDLDGIWNQSDGWGYLLGDHGSGAWIGLMGLQAALRAHDGRPNGSSNLLDHLEARFGHPLELVGLVYESPSPAHHLASFAPSVAEAAHAGDPVARRIWTEAGQHLGETAIAAASGLKPVFSWGGGLFEAGDLLMEPFQRTIRASLPDARFEPPRGGSVAGALALARAAADGTLPASTPYLHAFSSPG